jgi:LPS export ABC transporter permease LptG/LPS export ABC transporter permease LptF
VLKIIDRYLVREIVLPFLLGLVVLTFVLEIPTILREAESLIAKGVPWSIVARVLILLLPSALSLTIPMALLLGILVGLGRLSADREFVALQACGVSLFRLLRPIALLAVLATAATSYETIVALPDNNQTFREITFGVVADKLEKSVKPGVFFTDFPNRVIYVRDLPPDGGWRDVFMADTSSGDRTIIYFAQEGRIRVDRQKRTVTLLLLDVVVHTTQLSKPDEYGTNVLPDIRLSLDPTAVFPPPPTKGAPEMTIAELEARAVEVRAQGFIPYVEMFMIQQKFSLPFACPVLALIGLALGVSNRKDGKLASFVLGFVVIFIYYILLYFSRALSYGGWMSPSGAPWVPNVVLGAAGLVLAMWRAGSSDQPIRVSIPVFWQRREPQASGLPGAARPARTRIVVVVRVPHFAVPRPRLLDLYVARQYLRIFLFGVVALLGIFYISNFMEHAERIFRGTATTGLLLRYLYFSTPQFVYYVIPMSALLATLVTIGLMTKNSELIVMRACGVSLYRTSVPLLIFAIAASAVLFLMQQEVLPETNREAKRLEFVLRGFSNQTFGLLNRHWISATDGGIYHYDTFDPRGNRFTHLFAYRIDSDAWQLASLTYAKEVTLAETPSSGDASAPVWRGRQGWTRTLAITNRGTRAVKYEPFAGKDLPLEPPGYFKTENLEPEWMTYGQLKRYVTQLRSSGLNAVPNMVELQRKVSFPLVTIVMTLLAVPFAVTTGRRGTLYGIGVGIVLAIVYWITLSVFAAMGAGGLIPPTLAAWAPNILFAAAAVYMILTVRT